MGASGKAGGKVYVLLSSDSTYTAVGVLLTPPENSLMEFRVIEGSAEDLAAVETVQMVDVQEDRPIRLGRVVRWKGDRIVAESLQEFSEKTRQNIRMPVDFKSFVYPASGGQIPIRGVDLSCGGIAFVAERQLPQRERFEVVIPITSEGPVILRADVLREKPEPSGGWFYAAQFKEVIHDQEAKVREAVFGIQVRGRVSAITPQR